MKGVLHIKLAPVVLPCYFPFFVYIGFIGRVLDGLHGHVLAVSSSTSATKSNEIAENKQR